MKENLSLNPEETHQNLPSKYIDKENLMCDKCPKVFNSENQIQKHINRVHMKEEKLINALECKTCEKKFRVPSIYVHHYQETHGSLPPEYIHKNLFFCEKCPRAFLSKTQLTDHIYKFHFLKENKSQEEKIIEVKNCKTCVKQFRSPSIYINHYQEEHGSVPPEYSDKTLFFCEKCPKAYLSKTQLTKHIQKSHYSKEIKKSNETNASGCEVNVIEK